MGSLPPACVWRGKDSSWAFEPRNPMKFVQGFRLSSRVNQGPASRSSGGQGHSEESPLVCWEIPLFSVGGKAKTGPPGVVTQAPGGFLPPALMFCVVTGVVLGRWLSSVPGLYPPDASRTSFQS